MAATLADKLLITPERTVILMRAPDRHFSMLGPFQPGEATADVVLLYSRSEEQVVREVTVTVVHEIAHHFGIDDARLHQLGWG